LTIAEAEREGWLGEIEGLKISLAGANEKLAQIDRRSQPATFVPLGIPTIPGAIGHHFTTRPNTNKATSWPAPINSTNVCAHMRGKLHHLATRAS
jgi:hypothetical protein